MVRTSTVPPGALSLPARNRVASACSCVASRAGCDCSSSPQRQQELVHGAQVGLVVASSRSAQLVPQCFDMRRKMFAASRHVGLQQQRRATGESQPAVFRYVRQPSIDPRCSPPAVHPHHLRTAHAGRAGSARQNGARNTDSQAVRSPACSIARPSDTTSRTATRSDNGARSTPSAGTPASRSARRIAGAVARVCSRMAQCRPGCALSRRAHSAAICRASGHGSLLACGQTVTVRCQTPVRDAQPLRPGKEQPMRARLPQEGTSAWNVPFTHSTIVAGRPEIARQLQ